MYFDIRRRSQASLYTGWEKKWTVLKTTSGTRTKFYESRTEYIFVPKLYVYKSDSTKTITFSNNELN